MEDFVKDSKYPMKEGDFIRSRDSFTKLRKQKPSKEEMANIHKKKSDVTPAKKIAKDQETDL